MKKDLVIGGIGGYEYHQIENWVNSLNKSGFDGDKILVSYGSSQEVVNKLQEEVVSAIENFSDENNYYNIAKEIAKKEVEKFLVNNSNPNVIKECLKLNTNFLISKNCGNFNYYPSKNVMNDIYDKESWVNRIILILEDKNNSDLKIINENDCKQEILNIIHSSSEY